MTSEEFEEVFGNTPFEELQKIKDFINKDFISKDKIRETIEEIKKIEDDGYGFVSVNNMKKFEIEVLEDLLKE